MIYKSKQIKSAASLPNRDPARACLIEDSQHTNGIYVQSKRVRRYNLNDGDVVQVGQHESCISMNAHSACAAG